MKLPTIFSGIQPSGNIHLGNYLGALTHWVELQRGYNCIYSVVDLHALTVRQDADELRKACRDVVAMLVAIGIDPRNSILFVQSHVRAHSELAWLLSCFTYMGELGRMAQFREKSVKNEDNINAGLFTYPVLQAADILLYQTNLVPVGEDQRQHLELTRDLALRLNGILGDVFAVPEAHTPKEGARIKSLQDAGRKMSKSDNGNERGIIYLIDSPEKIRAKIKRAVTDSEGVVAYSAEKPGISNLLNIYAAIRSVSALEAEAMFAGMSYGALKEGVAEAVVAALEPIRQRYEELCDNPAFLDSIINEGAERANEVANKTIGQVKTRLGLS